MSNSITLPSKISIYPSNLNSTSLDLELRFNSMDETIEFLESLFRINPQSLTNPNISGYLIYQLQPRAFDLIVKVLEYDPSTAQILFKHLLFISNTNQIRTDLLDYLFTNYSKYLSVPDLEHLQKAVELYGLDFIDKLFEYKIVTSTDRLLQRCLYKFTPITDPVQFDLYNETRNRLIQMGISLNYTFEASSKTRIGFVVTPRRIVIELLKVPPPAGVDPNLRIRLYRDSPVISVWCLAMLLNDYETFKLLIDRGANIWETDSDGFILVNVWNEITMDRSIGGILDARFFEYFSKVGFNLNLYDTTYPNSMILYDLNNIIARNHFILEQESQEIIERLEQHYEGLINSGLNPINRETDIEPDGEFDDIIFRDIMEYLKSYPYSLANLSIFSMNKNGIPTRSLPKALRKGDAKFDLIKVISDNMNVYENRWENNE